MQFQAIIGYVEVSRKVKLLSTSAKLNVGNKAGSDFLAPKRDNFNPLFFVLKAFPSGLRKDETDRLQKP